LALEAAASTGCVVPDIMPPPVDEHAHVTPRLVPKLYALVAANYGAVIECYQKAQKVAKLPSEGRAKYDASSSATRRAVHERLLVSISIYPFVQITKDARCRAPDVAVAEWHGVDAEDEPVPVAALALVVLRRHQKSERHFEGLIGLIAV
jgi:hypothetical protein